MLADLIAVARIAQYLGAAVIFGAPLFVLYGLRGSFAGGPARALIRPMLWGAGLAVCAGSMVALSAQTAAMAGDPAAAIDLSLIGSVLSGTQFGHGLAARLIAALMALVATSVLPPKWLWLALAGLGAAVMASFAWTGHGAADEGVPGLVHLAADLLHLLAAGVWLGALAVLLLLTLKFAPADAGAMRSLHDGLAGFSGIGSAVVAVLTLTGLANTWFLVGPSHVGEIASSAYGLLLLAKLSLFALMLALAAVNRFRLTPRLEACLVAAGSGAVLPALRRSLMLETLAGALVLGVVGVMGALAPLSAS